MRARNCKPCSSGGGNLNLQPTEQLEMDAKAKDAKAKDAKLNDFIRLKQVPSAPVERWQRIPTVRHSAFAVVGEKKTGVQKPSSPLKQIPCNIQGNKTPETRRMVVKTPKDKVQSKTPKTPGIHKTPKSQITPGRTVQTPSSCSRFIPNRYTVL